MPMFVTFEVETNRVTVLSELAQRLIGVRELTRAPNLAELMNNIETAEIEAVKAKHAAAVESLGGGAVQLVRAG